MRKLDKDIDKEIYDIHISALRTFMSTDHVTSNQDLAYIHGLDLEVVEQIEHDIQQRNKLSNDYIKNVDSLKMWLQVTQQNCRLHSNSTQKDRIAFKALQDLVYTIEDYIKTINELTD